MRERSLSEETGMGALFRPKGVGTCGLGRLAGRATICCCGLGASLSDSVLLLPQLLNLEVINRPRVLHRIQRLHIRRAAGPRGV